MRQSKALLAIFALLLIFGACKGESPTAPPTGGGGGGGGGGNPPPTGTIEMSLTASNATPLVDSTVTITATVTQNGQPVANGTAVEFNSTGGGLDGTSETSLIKTTTNGVASVTLTSTVASTIRVSAIVGNVARTVDVRFVTGPDAPPPPPSLVPTIDEVVPAIGRPAGGERITIIGTNFRTPLRVLFDVGGPLPLEAFVESVSADGKQIVVISPAVNITAAQELDADIIIITEVGTPREQRIEEEDAFTYRNEILTPNISTATPNSGPVIGGTIVSILGDGFQAPVQVLFGSAEARVIEVDFNMILVEAPAGRDTSPDGTGPVTGPVSIRVRNINSQLEDILPDGFRYVNDMQIISVSPGTTPFTGGQRITIDGNGFVQPVTVVVRTAEGDISLQPISVVGSKIVAIAPGVDIDDCADVTGPIIVTNIVNGDQATGPIFRFFVIEPSIVGIRDSADPDSVADPGEDIEITVANAQAGFVRFEIGESTVFPTNTVFNEETGVAVYTLTVPSNFEFETEECSINGVEGERELPLIVDVTYINAETDCEDTVTDALTINPPSGGACEVPPSPEAGVTLSPTNGSCVAFADTAVTGATRAGTITFQNTGSAPMTVTLGTITGAQSTDFTVTPPNRAIPAGGTGVFDVVFNPSDIGPRNANVTFTTNDPDEGTFTICLTGNGIAP